MCCYILYIYSSQQTVPCGRRQAGARGSEFYCAFTTSSSGIRRSISGEAEITLKKKIAVFTNGWNDDYLDFALSGIKKRAAEDNIDVYIFMDYTSYDISSEDLKGELNILDLPELEDFDGVLLLGNTLNNAGENAILREKVLRSGVSAVCLEYELDDINCIRTENANGMRELVEHLITVHGAEDMFWISGPMDNDECADRYRAMVETMEKHGLKFNSENVFNGCWSYAIVEDKFPEVVKKMEKLPDAFVCANDSMALAVCVVLEKAGFNVPKDVIVTGYDNLMSGNHFSPILTSVDRGWNARSYQAMDTLIELMNGAPDFGDRVYESKLDLGESCGCSLGDVGLKLQKEARRNAFLIPVERTIFDWHLIELDKSVANVKTPEDIHTAYTKMWETNHDYEGEEFYLCLDQRFIDSIENDESCTQGGYSDRLDVIYGMKGGVTVPRHTISRRDIVPAYDADSKETAVYLIVTLHIGAETFGYYVSKDQYSIIKDFYLNSLHRHIASGLERARQNIRLENLNKKLADISVRDELTGLYNRMGYEKIVIPYLDELRRSKKKAVIMVADINRMKTINDRYGHLQGDTAIRIAAEVIRRSVPESWKAVRYGGDEYVMIGEHDSSDDLELLKNQITQGSGKLSQEMELPFRLSVSVGYVVIDPDNTLGNEEYFRMADEAMYVMKQEAHKNDG